MNILQDIPPSGALNKGDEWELGKSKTQDDKVKLTMGFLREAFLYAKQCCRQKFSDEEILSLSYLATLAAARKFKPNRGPFFPFAKIYLRWQLKKEWAKLDVVRNATNHISLDHTTHSRSQPNSVNVSVGDRLPEIDSTDATGQKIYDPPTSAFYRIEHLLELREQWRMIQPMIEQLSPRERMILTLHYSCDFDGAKIGRMLGICREAVRQSLLASVAKIKEMLEYPRA